MTTPEIELAQAVGKKADEMRGQLWSTIPVAMQYFQGRKQDKMANEMLRNLRRPNMTIPTAATESLNIARNLASTNEMPWQFASEQALNQQLAGGIYNATNTAASPAEALAASVALNANRMGAQTDLAGQAAQYKTNAMQNLQGALGDYAGLQQDVWDRNVWDKYVTDAATASALKQAGLTNKYNAVSNFAGIQANKDSGMDDMFAAINTGNLPKLDNKQNAQAKTQIQALVDLQNNSFKMPS